MVSFVILCLWVTTMSYFEGPYSLEGGDMGGFIVAALIASIHLTYDIARMVTGAERTNDDP